MERCKNSLKQSFSISAFPKRVWVIVHRKVHGEHRKNPYKFSVYFLITSMISAFSAVSWTVTSLGTSQRLYWRFKTVELSCLCRCSLFPSRFKKERL